MGARIRDSGLLSGPASALSGDDVVTIARSHSTCLEPMQNTEAPPLSLRFLSLDTFRCSTEKDSGLRSGMFLGKTPTTSPLFEAHFPSFSLVPAYIIMEWIIHCVSLLYGDRNHSPGESEEVLEFRSLKFLSPITPGQQLSIELQEQGQSSLRVSISTQAFSENKETPSIVCKGVISRG